MKNITLQIKPQIKVNKKQIQFLLNEKYIDKLDIVCDYYSLSRIEFIRQIIEESFKAIEENK
jgi:hypothetical protein